MLSLETQLDSLLVPGLLPLFSLCFHPDTYVSPFLARGPSAPVLPIAIRCRTTEEAERALGLQDVFNAIHDQGIEIDKDPVAFATNLFLLESKIAHILPLPTTIPIYAIYRGRESAIYIDD